MAHEVAPLGALRFGKVLAGRRFISVSLSVSALDSLDNLVAGPLPHLCMPTENLRNVIFIASWRTWDSIYLSWIWIFTHI